MKKIFFFILIFISVLSFGQNADLTIDNNIHVDTLKFQDGTKQHTAATGIATLNQNFSIPDSFALDGGDIRLSFSNAQSKFGIYGPTYQPYLIYNDANTSWLFNGSILKWNTDTIGTQNFARSLINGSGLFKYDQVNSTLSPYSNKTDAGGVSSNGKMWWGTDYPTNNTDLLNFGGELRAYDMETRDIFAQNRAVNPNNYFTMQPALLSCQNDGLTTVYFDVAAATDVFNLNSSQTITYGNIYNLRNNGTDVFNVAFDGSTTIPAGSYYKNGTDTIPDYTWVRDHSLPLVLDDYLSTAINITSTGDTIAGLYVTIPYTGNYLITVNGEVIAASATTTGASITIGYTTALSSAYYQFNEFETGNLSSETKTIGSIAISSKLQFNAGDKIHIYHVYTGTVSAGNLQLRNIKLLAMRVQ